MRRLLITSAPLLLVGCDASVSASYEEGVVRKCRAAADALTQSGGATARMEKLSDTSVRVMADPAGPAATLGGECRVEGEQVTFPKGSFGPDDKRPTSIRSRVEGDKILTDIAFADGSTSQSTWDRQAQTRFSIGGGE